MASYSNGIQASPASRGEGQSLSSAAGNGGIFHFAFPLTGAAFARVDNDLTVTLSDGESYEYADFFQNETALADVTLTFADGNLIHYQELIDLITIETAAGRVASPSAASSGTGEYDDNAGELLSGVTRLGADATDMGQWSNGTAGDRGDGYAAQGAATAGLSEPGGSPLSPEPEVPESEGYISRAVLYGDSSDGQAVFRLLESGVAVDARDVLFQASALNGYFVMPPLVNADGTLSLTLSDAGRAALAAGGGEHLFDYIAFTVNGEEYIMQAVVNRGGNYAAASLSDPDADAPQAGSIVAEWHTDSGGDAGGERVTGDSRDEILISSDSGTGFTGGISTGGGGDQVVITGRDKGTDNAVIATGGGNDTVAITGLESTGVYYGSLDMGNGDNRVTIRGAASAVSGAALSAGDGDDVFILNGAANHGLALGSLDAGNGDNSLSISGGNMGVYGSTITTGSGNDTIIVNGGKSHGIYSSTILAGDGNNLITSQGTVGASNSTIKTGSGNDTITLTGTWTYGMESGILDAGNGDNSISITGLGGTNGSVRTGSGNDTITITGTGSQGLYGQSNNRPNLDAGDGDNAILVSGTVGAFYSDIISGSGNDTVGIIGRSGNGFDRSSLDVGDGDNMVSISGKLNAVSTSSIVSGTGDDVFYFVSTGGSGMYAGSLDVSGGNNQVDIQAKTYGLNNSGIRLGGGDDLISVSAVNAGNAAALYASGNASSSIDGGLGHDVLYLDAVSTGSGKAYGMWGMSDLSLTGLEELYINARSATGDAYGMYAQNGAVSEIGGSGGAVTVVIKAVSGSAAYAMYASGGKNLISGNSGAGDESGDRIELHGKVHAENGGENSIAAGEGDDVISLDGAVSVGALYINAGDGFDTLILTAESSDDFNARYKDWLMDLDARGLVNGMSIESITVHGITDLDGIAWLRDFARGHGMELDLGDGNIFAQSGAANLPGLESLFSDLVAPFGPETQDDGPAALVSVSEQAPVSHEQPFHDAEQYRLDMQADSADQAQLLWLTNGVTS